jgi:hypothetical protein
MKALETQYAELKEKIVAAEVKKGFSESAVETTIKETITGETIEEKLGRLQKYAKKVGITESGRPARVERKNGSAINEAGTEDRIQKYMKKGFTLRESYVMCGLKDPGPKAKQPAAFTESLIKAWDKYCGGLISEADCRTLAEKGISPE